jgi:hypothetical protein
MAKSYLPISLQDMFNELSKSLQANSDSPAVELVGAVVADYADIALR